MPNDRIEWVEIIQPKTNKHMYANLSTGECVWDPPLGVNVKKTDNNQWWELFDENTSRFYYYNATSQKTVWHRPPNSDIIPLAKLQTLKQNTEPAADESSDEKPVKETVATQTQTSSPACVRIQTAVVASTRPIKNVTENPSVIVNDADNATQQVAVSCETQTSPILSPKRSHHHHHHHHHHRHKQSTANRTTPPLKCSSSPWFTRNTASQDSGRSSNSSSVSAKGTSLESASSITSPERVKSEPSNANKPQKDQPPRIVTPAGHRSQQYFTSNKLRSFDTDISIGGGYSLNQENRSRVDSCARSQLTAPTSSASQVGRSQSFKSRPSPSSVFPSTFDADFEEDESMHEKYFSPNILAMQGRKLLESAPMARRKVLSEGANSFTAQNTQKGNSDGEKLAPDYANFVSPPPPPSCSSNTNSSVRSHSSSNSSTVASYTKHQLPLITARSVERFSSSEDIQETLDRLGDSSSISVSSSPPTAATPPFKLTNPKCATTLAIENNFEYNVLENLEAASQYTTGSGRSSSNNSLPHLVCKKSPSPAPTYNASRNSTAPLYSNYPFEEEEEDLQMLPLHQYILEQAKLSGCYRFADNLEDKGEWKDESGEGDIETDAEERLRVEYDSDEFADDEGMSNVEDEDEDEGSDSASSQEYLHDDSTPMPPFMLDEYRNNKKRLPVPPPSVQKMFKGDDLDGRLSGNGANNRDLYYNVVGGHGDSPLSINSKSNHFVRVPSPNTPTGLRSNAISPSLDTKHSSLRRRKDQLPTLPVYSPIMERSERLVNQSSLEYNFFRRDFARRSDHAISYLEEARYGFNQERKMHSESDIERYAEDNLNIHKRGIFRKKFSIRAMLSWSKDPIRKPMLMLSDKTLKAEACNLFKLVQIYMGDRKAKIGMTLNNVALEICNIGYNNVLLRDELYIQICRQTTENPRKESLRRGWELLAICLSFFPPTPKFQVYLDSYMNRHRDPSYDNFSEVGKWPVHVQVSHYATVACKRLQRCGVNGRKQPKKPSLDEIDQARLQIFRPSMFGSTLEEIMDLQKERFPHHKLPWLQTTLSELILRLNGESTEGIFRVPADMDEVMNLKTQLDRWEVDVESITDAHTPASLLKFWYRELYQPLIPDAMYEQCVANHENPTRAIAIVERLPQLNKYVLAYLVRFLQTFCKPEVSQITKMDSSNLAMVMAPNILRCTSQDPRIIFDNARKEMGFMRTLIQHMDTSFVEGIF